MSENNSSTFPEFDLDPTPCKRCACCKAIKPLDSFAWKKGRKGRLRKCSWCHPCSSQKQREKHARQMSNPNSARVLRTRIHATRLRMLYGITATDYDRMLSKQDGRCAICRKPETALGRGGKPKRISVDHCHATGLVRGLLCHRCNSGIGKFLENIETLEAAIDYLRSSREKIA